MKVAFPTNNLRTIAPHVALSKYIAVLEIQKEEITNRVAIKNPLIELAKEMQTQEDHHRGLGVGRIIPKILSEYRVDLFIAKEIGEGMFFNIKSAGINVIQTEEKQLEKIIKQLKKEGKP